MHSRDLCGFKRDLTEFEGTEMKDASQVNCTADWTAADPHSHPPSILDGGSRNSPSGQNADWWFGDAALAAMDVDEMVRQHVLRTNGLPEAAKGDSFFVEDDEWSASFQEEMVALAASVSQVSRDVTKTKESPPLLPQPSSHMHEEDAVGDAAMVRRSRSVLVACTPELPPPRQASPCLSFSARVPGSLDGQWRPSWSLSTQPPLPQLPLSRSLALETSNIAPEDAVGGAVMVRRTVLAACTPEPLLHRQLSPRHLFAGRVPDSLDGQWGPSSSSDASTSSLSSSNVVSWPSSNRATATHVDPLPDTQPRASFQL